MYRIFQRRLLLAALFVMAVQPALAGEPDTLWQRIEREDGVLRHDVLPPGPDNPRNSEGDFIELKDGRILFVYTHFTGGSGDHSPAHLAARFSSDHGRTWTQEDTTIVPNEADMNVMSVSLVRLRNGEIGLFYMQKHSLEDNRPVMRISRDEGATWSEPFEIIPDREIGYYVLNNDRVVTLPGGRLIVPVARHNGPDRPEWSSYGHITCYLSNDYGRTWHRSTSILRPEEAVGADSVLLQEPGVIPLADNRLMMYMRTDQGSQYLSFSTDGGETWTDPEPSALPSPTSPAHIARIPHTGDLLVVWNKNGSDQRRTPLTVAVSKNEGRDWQMSKVLYDKPNWEYHYPAVFFSGGRVIIGHQAAPRDHPRISVHGNTRVTSFDVEWLYE